MSIFNNRENTKALSPKEALENKYKSSLSNLLLVLVFSAVNIVLLITNSDTYFLFSAFLPYFAVDCGMYLCGKYPEDYYYGDEVFLDQSFFVVTIVIAVIMLLLYLISWLFAKKGKVSWLIFSLVFFVVDSVSMFLLTEIGTESIIDIVFHIWVIVSLAMGIQAHNKLKNLPDEAEACEPENEPPITEMPSNDSEILRMADNEVKARVLIEAEAEGHHIVFRRVKRTNELVIDGKVYAEYVALAESAHTLSALVGGHKIEAYFDGFTNLFIYVDGQQVAKKMRLI